uniref:DM14 domain-containing protein n=1 Tax=Plectus sambesii TaxID=2011161 RepID=A0A914WVX9_9BILA
MANRGGEMDFSSIESIMYGNVDDDDELNAELMALVEDEKAASRAAAPRQAAAAAKQAVDFAQIDRLAKQISLEDPISDDDDDETVENDVDLLDELGDLIGEEPSAPVARPAAASSSVAKKDTALISMLQERAQAYRVAEANAKKTGDSAKTRRFNRGVKTLEDLLKKAERGAAVDPDEIPVAIVVGEASAPAAVRAAPAPPASAAKPATDNIPPPARAAPAPLPRLATNIAPQPTPTPATKVEAQPAPKPVQQTQPTGTLAISRVRDTLVRRRDEYKKNAALAMRAKDKGAAVEFVRTAQQFDAAIAAVDSGNVGDDLDMSVVPPSPDPYKAPSATLSQTDEPKAAAQRPQAPTAIPPPPKTFLEGLEQRLAKYRDAVSRAKEEGNERKQRQNERIVKQYAEAIRDHKAGKPVDVLELPAPPGYPPLPQATGRPAGLPMAPASAAAQAAKARQHPAGPFGPVASPTEGGPSPPKQSRNSQQLDFLEHRQMQFKQAALLAKQKGDMELAKKYLRAAKGFDNMIEASRAGLPVNIKDAPIPPQVRTVARSLEPTMDGDSSTSSISITGTREEVFATLEKDLIRQVQICDRNREYFTRLGDVGQVNKYETQATTLKRDLVTLRQAAKGGDPLPRFRYEMKAFPSLDICPDLGDDDL